MLRRLVPGGALVLVLIAAAASTRRPAGAQVSPDPTAVGPEAAFEPPAAATQDGPAADPVEPLDTAAALPFGFVAADSEVVYGPTLYRFEIESFVVGQGGSLAAYTERVGTETLSGGAIVERVAVTYSVGPRVLLALLETVGGWVTGPEPVAPGELIAQEEATGLFEALSSVADDLNGAYYGHRYQDQRAFPLADDELVAVSDVNPGSFAVLAVLGARTTSDAWPGLELPTRYYAAWTSLFGEPYAYQTTGVPQPAEEPLLATPFGPGEVWFYVAGPHPPAGDEAPWSAIDLAPPPPTATGCAPSPAWVSAAAAGSVVESTPRDVMVDVDGDGFVGTGWVHVYTHVSALERAALGKRLRTGDRIGHPSCEGGAGAPGRVALARRYDGEWVPTDHPAAPLSLGGWVPVPGDEPGAGLLVTAGLEPRRASTTKAPSVNGVTALP